MSIYMHRIEQQRDVSRRKGTLIYGFYVSFLSMSQLYLWICLNFYCHIICKVGLFFTTNVQHFIVAHYIWRKATLWIRTSNGLPSYMHLMFFLV